MKPKFLIMSFMFIFILASCQEDEFYEKDYIDTLKDQYERDNLPDEDTNETENPGYLPGDDDEENDCYLTIDCDNDDDGGDGDDGGSDPDLTAQSDSFNQAASGGKLDILWVVDNSGSMGDEQSQLAQNFNAFIQEFANKNIDFQMGVTTTDTRTQYSGKAYGDSLSTLTSQKLEQNRNRFMNDFARNIRVGTRGSGHEKGIKASFAFTNRYSEAPEVDDFPWMRDDAYFVVVYVSDEEDQSENSVEAYIDAIKATKGNNGLVKAYSIVQMVPSQSNGGIQLGYERYAEASERTGGTVADIRDDFYMTLLNMGEQISELADQFPLSQVPHDVNEIEVLVDGVVSLDWEYIVSANAVKFLNPPADGSAIEINYEY